MNSFSQPHPAPVPAWPKIVIARGGFAGPAAARRLRHAPVGVTLPGQGTGNIVHWLHQCATEAVIRTADHLAASQTPSPLYGPRHEVPGGS